MLMGIGTLAVVVTIRIVADVHRWRRDRKRYAMLRRKVDEMYGNKD